jgi:hypothetical protein
VSDPRHDGEADSNDSDDNQVKFQQKFHGFSNRRSAA